MTVPIGWEIWINVFAVWYTADNGPKANGWKIDGFMFTPVTLLFTIWVLRAKDSKHA